MIEGLYLHIPFCARRCHYCDFNTYENMESLAPAYVKALAADLAQSLKGRETKPLRSVFFGGGTPSLLEPSQIRFLLDTVREQIGLEENAEVTLEANPGTADLEKFAGFREAGVNRLSFGFQAKQDRHLESLGRIHSAEQSAEAWRLARQAGFKNLSLDLMFGLPDQTLEEWMDSLEWALGFQSEHLSFYGLTLEPGTRFYSLHEKGLLPTPVEDLQADMYEMGTARLARAGLAQYEISNFAKPGRESVHNRLYWRNRDTLGLGAGAWSYVDGERSGREKNPQKYMDLVLAGQDPRKEKERLEGAKARAEAVYLGLRLLEGINLKAWREQTGVDFMQEFGPTAQAMQQVGLLELGEESVRLSPKGLPLSNEVFSAFL
ncbi:MAG: radical SAM family heme chaperone HemW [candidate division FCPU426 bacterium]